MSLETELTKGFIEVYRAAGQGVGYWARRFLGSVKRNGGLATAKRMLLPRNAGQRQGLDALLDAKRPDLTVEAVILRPKFRSLFTADEIATARQRLRKAIASHRPVRQRLFPDELEPGHKYIEGSKRQVRVNAFERDPRARKACLTHHGHDCAVCGFNFQSCYGKMGKNFIHVHHLKPLSLTDGEYELDPVADLRPVCPNCHAMLHHGKRVLSIKELKSRLVT